MKVCFDIWTFPLKLPKGAAVTLQANYESWAHLFRCLPSLQIAPPYLLDCLG